MNRPGVTTTSNYVWDSLAHRARLPGTCRERHALEPKGGTDHQSDTCFPSCNPTRQRRYGPPLFQGDGHAPESVIGIVGIRTQPGNGPPQWDQGARTAGQRRGQRAAKTCMFLLLWQSVGQVKGSARCPEVAGMRTDPTKWS